MKKSESVVSVTELEKLIRQWEREIARFEAIDGTAAVLCQRTLRGCIDELESLIRYNKAVGSSKKRRVGV